MYRYGQYQGKQHCIGWDLEAEVKELLTSYRREPREGTDSQPPFRGRCRCAMHRDDNTTNQQNQQHGRGNRDK